MQPELENAVFGMQVLLAFGIVFQFLNELVNRSYYSEKGLLAWSTVPVFTRFSSNHLLFSVFRFSNTRDAVVVIMAIQAMLVSMLCFNYSIGVKSYLAIVAFALQLVINFRLRPLITAPLQMRLMILAGLCFYYLGNQVTEVYFVAFVCFHCLFSYFMPGVLKLADANWFSGHAIQGIILAKAHGENATLSTYLKKNPSIAKVLAIIVIIFECLMPLVALLHPYAAIAFIGAGITFHLVNAFVLGFNNFLFVFIAPYPVILYASYTISNMLWLQ